jgi:cell division septation protein DedD
LVAATATAIATEPVVRSELPATPVDRPFLQVATFSAEENAKRAVSDLNKSGLIASIVEEKSADKSLWRVLVGPATSQEERDALLVQLKTQGFDDAFAVSK